MAWVLDFSGVGWVGWRGLRSVCIGVNSREELKPEASHRNCCPQAKGVIPGEKPEGVTELDQNLHSTACCEQSPELCPLSSFPEREGRQSRRQLQSLVAVPLWQDGRAGLLRGGWELPRLLLFP